MTKLILNFNSKQSKSIKNPKNFLGGKGANLSEMGRMGLPVPPGFTISTKVCEIFYKDKKKLNNKLISQIKTELKIGYESIISFADPTKNFGLKLKKNIIPKKHLKDEKSDKKNNILKFSDYKEN